MDVPRGRVLEDDTLQQHILTVDERNHDRAQEALDSVPLFLGLGVGHIHVGTLLALHIALVGHPVALLHLHTARTAEDFLPLCLGDLRLLDRTPELAVTVDDALARDGDIRSTIGTQRRLAATGVKALKGGLDDRIQCLVARELDDGTHLEVKVDIALQHDRTCKPHTLGNDQTASALGSQRIDGLGKSLRVQGDAVAHGTKVLQIDLVVRNDWSTHLRHLEREVGGVLLVRIAVLAAGRLLCLSHHCDGQHQHTDQFSHVRLFLWVSNFL